MMRVPLTVYLDQSDLSYLSTGRGPAGTDYVRLRDRLVRLSERGMLRVRASFVHVTESLRLRWHSQRAILELLRSLPRASFVRNFPHEFWRAELARRELEIREIPIAAVKSLFWAPFVFFALADRPYAALTIWFRQELKREMKRGLPVVDERIFHAITRADMPAFSDVARATPLGVALPSWLHLRFMRWCWRTLQQRGYDDLFEPVEAYRKGAYGFGPHDTEVLDLARGRSSYRIEAMPALALSAAVRRSIGSDIGRRDLQSDDHDAWHVAYSAYCDVATADRRVLDATKQVRRSLLRPRWYPSGRLHELLDDIEAALIQSG